MPVRWVIFWKKKISNQQQNSWNNEKHTLCKTYQQKGWYPKVTDISSSPPWQCQISGGILLFLFCFLLSFIVLLHDFPFKWSNRAPLRLLGKSCNTLQKCFPFIFHGSQVPAPLILKIGVIFVIWVYHVMMLSHMTSFKRSVKKLLLTVNMWAMQRWSHRENKPNN